VLTGPVAFTLFSIFTALQFTVATLPIAMRSMAEARVCFDRMKKFLLLPEYLVQPQDGTDDNGSNDVAINLEDYNTVYEVVATSDDKKDKKNEKDTKDKKAKADEKIKTDNENDENVELIKEEPNIVQALVNVNLKVNQGQLIGVTGAVGSGKSSLISSIMSELKPLSGKAVIKGRLALVPQQAWIYSGTVRENVLFGSRYHEETFNEVIEAVDLKQDLDNWPNSDQTEVGERGLTLSGGQKQRISLARAVYAVMDDHRTENAKFVILLDDPLSAVDPGVAKHIFEKAITKMLKGHTILLVTHGMQFLSRCDKVAYMKNGSVVEFGTYDELMAAGKDFVNMVSFDQSQNVQKVQDNADQDKKTPRRNRLTSRSLSTTSDPEEIMEDLNIIQDEADQVNAGWSVLLKYFKVRFEFSIFQNFRNSTSSCRIFF
jgi:ATP-binding cassette subfamily C (CFTR/MRP) protein 1